ncbi:hypothetical protein [Ruegeria sp. HKCCA6837]|uniref:hypothetical protein n=1 Tax=Ruegeria sp. HKCCA6837 TaxID=2682989 RepID=UPI0014893ADE|nr:hypothetical protein [Ruegeria sp. HKCCA6837]
MSRGSVNPILNAHRDELTQNSIRLDLVWSLPWDDVCNLPVMPGFALSDDIVEVPVEMVPPAKTRLSLRQIDFTKALPQNWSRSEHRSEMALRRLKRIALLDLTQTVKSNRKMSPPQAHTWVARTRLLVRAAKMALHFDTQEPNAVSTCPDGVSIFKHLSPAAFQDLRKANPNFFQMNTSRLNAFLMMGLFDDWPAEDVSPKRFKSQAIQPFNDSAFSQVLRASFFLASIQHDLESCYAEISSITEDDQGRYGQDLVRRVRNEAIQSWRGDILEPGFSFPFELGVPGEARTSKFFSGWPVETLDGVKSLLLLCQCANAQILLSATAGRVSELKVLSKEPLKRSDDDTILVGYTFKETDTPAGEQRHWALPDHAVAAVKRQQSLLRTFGKTGPYLWWSKENNTTEISGMEQSVALFGSRVRTLNGVALGELDGKLTTHRFRKTLSRLVGLALEGANNILFDVLGHTDMDVTLGYMLSDAEFQADAEKVRQEHKHLLRVRIVNEIDECGGPSAPRIRVARDELRARGIREDLGDDDPELLLAVLPNIQQVGPERYCTAGDMENGLCSKFTGQRDVGACNSSCIFRLEMAASRQDRKEAIRNALQLLSGDVGRGIRVYFQSQIIGNLSVFESTIDEFLDDKRFKDALFDCEKRLFAPLPPSTREKLAQLVG